MKTAIAKLFGGVTSTAYQFKVTLPRQEEIKYRRLLLTDYAVATGARCGERLKLQGDDTWACCGDAWLRTASHATQGVDVYDNHGQLTYEYAGDRTLAIMPRFENPKAKNFGLTFRDNKCLLTINDIVACYPQTLVNDKLAQELTQALKTGKDIYEVGEFISDATPLVSRKTEWFNYDEKIKLPRQQQVNKCYLYQGKRYVYLENAKQYNQESIFHDGTPCRAGESYWFACEPLLVEPKIDGTIHCENLLLACQFEPQDKFVARKFKTRHGQVLDTNEFAIGEFMNGDFLRDLELSTDLSKIQNYQKLATFVPTVTNLQNYRKEDSVRRKITIHERIQNELNSYAPQADKQA